MEKLDGGGQKIQDNEVTIESEEQWLLVVNREWPCCWIDGFDAF